jgi:hypothetical protein
MSWLKRHTQLFFYFFADHGYYSSMASAVPHLIQS